MNDRRFAAITGWLLLVLPAFSFSTGTLAAVEPPSAEPASSDELALAQSQLADKYRNLEKLLVRMAEYDAGLNPHRSELLMRVFAESKNRQVQGQFETLVELLREQKLGQAMGNQKQLRRDLDAMLTLLMSENRADRIKSEKARVREYIREIERLERMQRSVQGRTEGGIPYPEAAKEQTDLEERTEALSTEIEKNEKPAGAPAAGDHADDGNTDTGEGTPPADDKPENTDEPDASPSKGEPPSTQRPSEPSEPPAGGEGEEPKNGPPATEQQEGPPAAERPDSNEAKPPQDSKPGSSPPSPSGGPGSGESPPADQDFPGQKNLQNAQKEMKEAIEKLEKAEREGAIQDQRQAAKELAEAKARLEEILRQLREEEIERTLALLESRVKSMLELEIRIHDETVRLDQAASSQVDRSWEIDAGKLSFEQRRVILEADKALALLHEEGSSAAFPETLEQARADMDQVARRLAQAKTGSVTQGIEEDIIAALEEMLEALKQAQNEQRQRQQNMPPMAREPGEMPLVDQIAELRMIKSLQLRINRRTDRYAQLLGDENDLVGQATDVDLVTALQELSAREARLHELTRDIVLGKNQ